MKIIDILNKINNREEVPEKIKFNGDVFIYNSAIKDYGHNIRPGLDDTLLFRVMNTHFITELLKAEVEVIEESEEINIQGIKPFIIPRIAIADDKDMWTDRIMINKLIKSVKQLDNKLKKEREVN